jgi:hypothetical protein
VRLRLAFLLVPALVAVAACGEDPPEQVAAASPDAPAETTAPVGGELIGDMAGSMTTTTTTTTTTVAPPTTAPVIPPTTTTVTPDFDPVGVDPVQELCDRVAVYMITVTSIGPDTSPEDVDALVQSAQDLASDASELATSLTPDQAQRLTDCLSRVTDAVPQ